MKCYFDDIVKDRMSVFIKLARDAGKMGASTPLAAWLHTVTRHTAINAARTESRRQKRDHA